MGLIPPDMDLRATALRFFEQGVSGFYDPGDRCLWIADTAPMESLGPLLAHELSHALDDQLFGLDATLVPLAGCTDAALAYLSVVEGSAAYIASQWLSEQPNVHNTERAPEVSAFAFPMRIWKPILAPYVAGIAFVDYPRLSKRVGLASGELVNQLYHAIPQSTEQVLHPDKYWDSSKRDEPIAVVISTESLPSGWSVSRQDTLGELILGILCTLPESRDGASIDADSEFPLTNEIVEGWGGDRVMLLSSTDEARFLLLVTVWDTVQDASEFYGALRILEPSLRGSAQSLVRSDRDSGAEVEYVSNTKVVLRVYAGVSAGDLRQLRRLTGQ
jgi:hypothetical protein